MYILRTHLTMVNWGVMFCKANIFILPYFLPIDYCLLKYLFVSKPVPLHIPFFQRFGFIPEFTKPSVVELSVLRGVAGCLWSNAIKAGRMPIYVLPLLKVTHDSASVSEGTTLRIVLRSVCIGPFLSGLGFIGLGEGQSLR